MSTRTTRWLAILLAFTFLAAACGGESSDGDGDASVDGTGDDSGDDSGDDGTGTGDDGTGDDGTGDDGTGDDGTGDDGSSGEPNFYEDPRGGVFDEFQQTYDRSDDPFTQIDAVCLPHDAASDRVDTDAGITADEVRIGHIRSRLEEAVDIGFGIPVGDPEEMFDVLVDYVNTECGGVRGRTVNLGYAEAPLLGDQVDAERNQACLAMTEDFDAVIVMNSSGFQGTANLCLVEEQETAFISTQGQTEEWMERGEDRLISMSPTLEESVRFMALDLIANGALEGKTLGVAAPNTPGQAEAVEAGLVDTLNDAGFDIVFDVIDCGGGTVCAGGVPQSVTNMRNAGVDVFFNVLNILSAPGYVAEMVNQGYEVGDVQFYASDFNSQASELVSGQIANNVDAGNLYNGAQIIDFRATGSEREPGFEPNPFAAECNRVYAENSPSGASHAWDDEGDSAYNMVSSVCSILRIALRAIYNAGDNPTVADVQAALANLGPVDTGGQIPASITPGKTQTADAIQTLDWVFPCDQPQPFTRANGEPICITGQNDWRPAPR
ncbi:MAG: ABC transporter substrate-binding protein [Acidimicrobiales bacterium]|nr:ABC transporter substrate-binding protein [Acidimicrobiales bacterium]